jgi:hypothetical protein
VERSDNILVRVHAKYHAERCRSRETSTAGNSEAQEWGQNLRTTLFLFMVETYYSLPQLLLPCLLLEIVVIFSQKFK